MVSLTVKEWMLLAKALDKLEEGSEGFDKDAIKQLRNKLQDQYDNN